MWRMQNDLCKDKLLYQMANQVNHRCLVAR